MVQDTRETLRTDTLKLNMPGQVRVQERGGLPVAVAEPGKRLVRLSRIEDRWRIDDEWWRRGPVSRLYYAVVLDSGQKMVLYKDLIGNRWYKQR